MSNFTVFVEQGILPILCGDGRTWILCPFPASTLEKKPPVITKLNVTCHWLVLVWL